MNSFFNLFKKKEKEIEALEVIPNNFKYLPVFIGPNELSQTDILCVFIDQDYLHLETEVTVLWGNKYIKNQMNTVNDLYDMEKHHDIEYVCRLHYKYNNYTEKVRDDEPYYIESYEGSGMKQNWETANCSKEYMKTYFDKFIKYNSTKRPVLYINTSNRLMNHIDNNDNYLKNLICDYKVYNGTNPQISQFLQNLK